MARPQLSEERTRAHVSSFACVHHYAPGLWMRPRRGQFPDEIEPSLISALTMVVGAPIARAYRGWSWRAAPLVITVFIAVKRLSIRDTLGEATEFPRDGK